ncbi:hypothetical protein NECID01_0990 [Nematocida sp. AWRm77]|nr:hypothetical protein NECID01_0990 [Nematocida sp. AWRm77]
MIERAQASLVSQPSSNKGYVAERSKEALLLCIYGSVCLGLVFTILFLVCRKHSTQEVLEDQETPCRSQNEHTTAGTSGTTEEGKEASRCYVQESFEEAGPKTSIHRSVHRSNMHKQLIDQVIALRNDNLPKDYQMVLNKLLTKHSSLLCTPVEKVCSMLSTAQTEEPDLDLVISRFSSLLYNCIAEQLKDPQYREKLAGFKQGIKQLKVQLSDLSKASNGSTGHAEKALLLEEIDRRKSKEHQEMCRKVSTVMPDVRAWLETLQLDTGK